MERGDGGVAQLLANHRGNVIMLYMRMRTEIELAHHNTSHSMSNRREFMQLLVREG